MNTFLYCPVARTRGFLPCSMSGDTVLMMMVDLGSLDPLVIRALKKVFKLLIQSSFWCRFSFGCPGKMSAVSVSLLPPACNGLYWQLEADSLG